MPLTRKDARMIAEELFALMEKEKAVPERYLNAKEAAELLGMPLGTLYHKVDGIPHKSREKATFHRKRPTKVHGLVLKAT